ncbi:hypothetical protein ACWDR9_17870, partial [Streptosporangium sandarakinum]
GDRWLRVYMVASADGGTWLDGAAPRVGGPVPDGHRTARPPGPGIDPPAALDGTVRPHRGPPIW